MCPHVFQDVQKEGATELIQTAAGMFFIGVGTFHAVEQMHDLICFAATLLANKEDLAVFKVHNPTDRKDFVECQSLTCTDHSMVHDTP